jgi:hypothetical protein
MQSAISCRSTGRERSRRLRTDLVVVSNSSIVRFNRDNPAFAPFRSFFLAGLPLLDLFAHSDGAPHHYLSPETASVR